MTVYDLKPRFQALLRPHAAWLAGKGVTANQVTLAALAGSICVGALLLALPQSPSLFALLPIWLVGRMTLNALDGILAREHGQASALGAYLNEIADVISDAALVLPFGLLTGASAWAVGAVAGLAFLAELAGVLGVLVGASRRYDGPMGKSDRALVLGVLGSLVAAGLGDIAVLPSVWIVFGALIAVTVVNRVRQGLAERTFASTTKEDSNA
jgi:CDP-diacylglycerol--glycerol-3-phosphate 3-phosphatidyltransferase